LTFKEIKNVKMWDGYVIKLMESYPPKTIRMLKQV